MFTNLSIKSSLPKAFKRSFASLYTWGRNTGSLGYDTKSQRVLVPQKVSNLPSNIKNVVMGVNHSAVITEDGQLFTFGSGKYGALGHNDGEKTHITPKLVEFFSKKALKVTQVAIGENHTVALTHDGDVWTWGYGGRSSNFLLNLVFSSSGALGHGDSKHRHTPTPITTLRNLPAIKTVTTGYRFALALNIKNELYKWGRGEYGVFGDGNNRSLAIPRKSEFFDSMKKEENQEIIKLKSANNYTMALMNNGQLYGWGSNESGQMGTRTEIGVEIYETANFPTSVVREDFKESNIVDFDVGEDITGVLLDNNEVYWSGCKLAYKPELLRLPKDVAKIKQIAVCFRSIAALTVNNEIYMKNSFVQHQSENIETGVMKTDNSIFGKEEIIEIGGVYRNCYAITKN